MVHIRALEILDELGLRPSVIAGTSMGAIIGSLYASGPTGAQIRNGIERHIITKGEGIKEVYEKRHHLMKWLNAIQLTRRAGGLLKADGFFAHLFQELKVESFEELVIPFRTVAADFHSGEPVVFTSGPLLPAIQASMSIPGVFTPVEHDGRILVDGGVVNNLPYDIIQPECDFTIAIDVAPTRGEGDEMPNIVDATLGMFDILVDRVTQDMLEDDPPDMYVRPILRDIRVLEFDHMEDVF